jgi:hypothetical protein
MNKSTLVRPVSLALACFMTCLAPARADVNLPVYTTPIEITGTKLSITAFAPDKNTGVMVPQPIPPGAFGPKLAALTAVPINVLMDGRWNGTPAQVTAGTSPRQAACDGPSGVKAQVSKQASDSGSRAYDISCNFGTTGQVYVRQVGNALYLSYQVLNNSASFRTTSHFTCNQDNGTFLCPNDPSFQVRFAFEMLTLIWTPQLCAIHAEPPDVYLHGVQITSHNLAADTAMFIDEAFKGDRFLAGELAMEAQETRAPITIDDAFAELRNSPSCAGTGLQARVFRLFSELDTLVTNQGVEFRATHLPIAAPSIQNVSLPYGVDTCVQGFVWREAFPEDHVCVTPQIRTQAANDNAQAGARRSPNGGPFGPATCKQGFVWREARVGDLVCVPPATRSQAAADNAAASARRLLQPSSTPSFTRPSITAPPVVAAGASFPVSGQFFPATIDPTTINIYMDRNSNTACFGGATELETLRGGAAPVSTMLPASPGSISACNYRYQATALPPSTQFQFRARDCDAVTCSGWSNTFQTMTGAANVTSSVQLLLDSGIALGSAVSSATGTFNTSPTMPAGTASGIHKLTGVSGSATDTISIQVTGGRSVASITTTGAFFGDRGCPMRPSPHVIDAQESFTLFGSGFQPGTVNIRLDTLGGADLGSTSAQADGTFCASFNGPPFAAAGAHNLVAIQGGGVRATLAVTVVIDTGIH